MVSLSFESWYCTVETIIARLSPHAADRIRRLSHDRGGSQFIDRNGASFKHPPDGLDGTALAIERLAAGELDEAGFIEWMKERIE